ncbi:MAG: hypothetical protein AAFS07_13260 [Pseudomonadota bacterium]
MDLGPILVGVLSDLQPLLIIAIATVAIVEAWSALFHWRGKALYHRIVFTLVRNHDWLFHRLMKRKANNDDENRVLVEDFVRNRYVDPSSRLSKAPRIMATFDPAQEAMRLATEYAYMKQKDESTDTDTDSERADRVSQQVKSLSAALAATPLPSGVTLDLGPLFDGTAPKGKAGPSLQDWLADDFADCVALAEIDHRRKAWLYALAIATLLAAALGTALPGLGRSDGGGGAARAEAAGRAIERHVEVLGPFESRQLLFEADPVDRTDFTRAELEIISVLGRLPPEVDGGRAPLLSAMGPWEDLSVDQQRRAALSDRLRSLLNQTLPRLSVPRRRELEIRWAYAPQTLNRFFALELLSALTTGFVVALLARSWFARQGATGRAQAAKS